MAPLKPMNKNAPDKRVQTVLDKARELSRRLKRRDEITKDEQAELEKLIKSAFPSPAKTTSDSVLTELESCASEIWNASILLIRSAHAAEDGEQTARDGGGAGFLIRIFAFMLLDFAFHSSPRRQKYEDKLVRNLKIGIKACKACLEAGELDLASTTIQKCGQYAAAVTEDSPLVQLTNEGDKDNVKASLDDQTAQLRLLRMAHAWRIERLDLAEHFYHEFLNTSKTSVALVEGAAELLYEIGRALLARKLEEPAEKWLQRALSTLKSCDVTQLDRDAFEMRLAISTSLIKCMTTNGSAASLQRAQSLIDELENSHGLGNRMVVQMLQLKVILAGHQISEERLNNVMACVVRSAPLSEHTFKTMMKVIHRVNQASHVAACRALEDFLTSRLLPDVIDGGEMDHQVLKRVEQVCVTYALLVVQGSQRAQHVTIDWLQGAYDATAAALNGTYSSKATHAMQALVYKIFPPNDANVADKWLRILRHPLFNNAGQVNKAKIGRKAIYTAMSEGNLEAASEAFYQMSETTQNESHTRYLTFKLALQSNNYQFALDSLNIVVKRADRDPKFLYGCVLEAQQSKMRQLAVAALLAILDKAPAIVHYAALLRCTARLLIGELEYQQRSINEVMEQTLHVFESASGNTQALLSSSGDQKRAEIQWWTKNAYNTAAKHCCQIHPEHLVRMLRACTQIMAVYPRDDGLMHIEDLERRALLCHLLTATALVVLARSYPDESEERLQYYLEARREIANFMSACQQLRQSNQAEKAKTLARVFDMLKFDLECIMNLRQWDQLDEALQTCLKLEGIDRWDTLADIALNMQRKLSAIDVDSSTGKRLTELLQRVINDTWKKERNMAKAGRWLRISFSYDHKNGGGTFALDLLHQAMGMAKKGYDGKTDPFPEMELQWLSTTAFNKAVDLLSHGDGIDCKQWLEGALELARYSCDNGALHASLTDKKRLFDERLKETVQDGAGS